MASNSAAFAQRLVRVKCLSARRYLGKLIAASLVQRVSKLKVGK